MMAVGVTALEPMTVDTQAGMPSPAATAGHPDTQAKDDGGADDSGSALREALG